MTIVAVVAPEFPSTLQPTARRWFARICPTRRRTETVPREILVTDFLDQPNVAVLGDDQMVSYCKKKVFQDLVRPRVFEGIVGSRTPQ